MFELLKAKIYLSKIQAELKSQYGDQAFVNKVCQLPENIEQLRVLREQAYYRKDRIAPFLNVCHILGESMSSESLSEGDREICASLLAQRLQKAYSDPQFRLRHITIFGDLEDKIREWAAENWND